MTVFFLYVAFGIDVLEWIRKKRLKSKELDTDDEFTGESIFDKDQINIENSETDVLPEPVPLETETTLIEKPIPIAVEEPKLKEKSEKEEENLELEIEHKAKEEKVDKSKQKEHYGIDEPFDPRLDLRDYVFPEVDFLNKYDEGPKTEVSKEDLEKSKNMIVQTLNNYKIGIAQIKATIGPTVTLFEIVPEAGVRISKIKNLEDDIALSLAALGIRIIAPIPGKGTIGIEVPNKKPEIVSMHSVISSAKYQNSDAALPVCLGKTISNEVYVADLAKMPHLLMAGATGQGKSVGLNAIIVSLLYRKHPAELKFVMVDPKKVELTLYQTIERHYLAKLPGEVEAIITDNKQV
ncbi:MAG: DNA translocase FtsK, partial [Burkholderiaceae bacterium]